MKFIRCLNIVCYIFKLHNKSCYWFCSNTLDVCLLYVILTIANDVIFGGAQTIIPLINRIYTHAVFYFAGIVIEFMVGLGIIPICIIKRFSCGLPNIIVSYTNVVS